jgi:hypothetical protein
VVLFLPRTSAVHNVYCCASDSDKTRSNHAAAVSGQDARRPHSQDRCATMAESRRSKFIRDLITNPCRDRPSRVQPSPRRAGAMCGERELFRRAPSKLTADADMLAAPHRHLRRAILPGGLLPTSSSHRDAPNRRAESACSPPSRIYLWPLCAT